MTALTKWKYTRQILALSLQRRSIGVPLCSKHAQQLCSTSTSNQGSFYDVVISGGGMVGAAMAAVLGHTPELAGRSVLVLEAGSCKRISEPPAIYSSRTCAISPATKELLNGCGAWSHIESMRYQAVKRMQVWDSCSDALIAFTQNDLLDNLAYIVENDLIQESIQRSIEEAGDRVEMRYGVKIQGYTLAGKAAVEPTTENRWTQVHLETGETINTRLLIGADGPRSLVRETAEIHTLQWDYDQMGVVATLQISEPTENNVAWQRFLNTGPIALLPLSQEHCCLIWSTTPEDAKTLLQLEQDSFVDAVNNAFWSDECKDQAAEYVGKVLDKILGGIGLESRASQQLPPTVVDAEMSTRAAFPLGFGHASHYVAPRLALIGDSAHRCHPMAGQGVNLGFGDVACLRDHLATAIKTGSDLGSLGHLLEYETSRQRHVTPTLLSIDALYRLYRTAWTPVVVARTLGLQASNAFTPLKEMFIQHATR